MYAATESALLLEDLTGESPWRLATAADLADASFGRRLAEWYRTLHDTNATAPHLHTEYGHLDATRIAELGDRLNVGQTAAWQLAQAAVERLTTAMAKRPKTLVYNDFHLTNVAISDTNALLFDYDSMLLGTPASDCRNVASSLHGAALDAFRDAYGPLDSLDQALDAPLAVIAGLDTASRRGTFPRWATPLLAEVHNGALDDKLRTALDLLR